MVIWNRQWSTVTTCWLLPDHHNFTQNLFNSVYFCVSGESLWDGRGWVVQHQHGEQWDERKLRQDGRWTALLVILSFVLTQITFQHSTLKSISMKNTDIWLWTAFLVILTLFDLFRSQFHITRLLAAFVKMCDKPVCSLFTFAHNLRLSISRLLFKYVLTLNPTF